MEDAPHPTERFERVIAFASDEADGLGHGYITCQHLLVALCRESQGLARAVFDRFGVMPEAVSSLLADTAAPHDRTVAQPLELAFETRHAMQRAIAAAVWWGDRTLDTEHLLYGLLSERSSADDLLGALNLKPDALLAVLTQLRQAAPPAAVREEAAHAYRFTVESGWLLALAAEFARGHAAVTSVHLLAALLELQTPAAAVFE
ncbi:MAG: Clp protease N-terminal domain-containing protein, partial [Anaerolineae bacterium]